MVVSFDCTDAVNRFVSYVASGLVTVSWIWDDRVVAPEGMDVRVVLASLTDEVLYYFYVAVCVVPV